MKASRHSVHGKPKPKKKMGRPATGVDPAVTVRIPPAVLAAVLRWGKKHGYNRSTAINGLIQRGLKSCGEAVEE